jgi:hypothetical protein
MKCLSLPFCAHTARARYCIPKVRGISFLEARELYKGDALYSRKPPFVVIFRQFNKIRAKADSKLRPSRQTSDIILEIIHIRFRLSALWIQRPGQLEPLRVVFQINEYS